MSTKDWLEKDYYKVLGVSKDAKPEDVKKAFRKIARENHPDANPGNDAALQRFKDASEANQVLSDAKQRKEYDATRSRFGGFRFPSGGGGGSTDDLFRNAAGGAQGGDISDLFGGLFNNATRRPGPGRGPRRGSDVEGEVTIDFVDAIDGVTVNMQMLSDAACPTCHGTGARSGSVPTVCPKCQGSGMQTSTSGGVFAVSEPCADCRGRGLVVEDPCPDCHGSGRGRSAKNMSVRIPAGVTDAAKIRLKGKGGAGENAGASGDLYVTVHVRPHPVFGRSGNNVTVAVPVTFAEASLGAEIEVPTLKGQTVRLKLPAGTPGGRTMRVRGKGVRRTDGTVGDLLVTIEVVVPQELSKAARSALQTFVEAAPAGDPRAELFERARR